MLGGNRSESVAQGGNSPSWLKVNEGVIGPPIAHAVAAAGLLSTMGLTHVLVSMGYLISKTWSVVLILGGYAIPFAIARELVAKRTRKKASANGVGGDAEKSN
jgi:hypothetical protein